MKPLTREQQEVQDGCRTRGGARNNLYHIMPEGGGLPIPFRPHPEQQVIYKHLLEPCRSAFIVKSRRLGFSTALGVFAVDKATWSVGQKCMLVDMTQPDAWKKMREIIRYAFDTMPSHLKPLFSNPKREDSQLSIRAAGEAEMGQPHLRWHECPWW